MSDGTTRDQPASSTAAPRPSVSVVINTLNEAARLSFALRSVQPWANEIVVVDMESDDATVEIARSFGARVETHPRVGYADPARALAVGLATSDWVLILDADEVVPPALARRLLDIASGGACDVVSIPWSNYLLGAPLGYTGWGPTQDRHARFFRRGSIQVRPDIHDYLRVAPAARVMELPYEAGFAVVHLNYVDVSQFITKLNRYTDIEADALLARGRGRGGGYLAALADAARESLRRYVRQSGWRDGWRGFYLSMLMAFYRLAVHAKVRERRVNGPRSEVERQYLEVAERTLADD